MTCVVFGYFIEKIEDNNFNARAFQGAAHGKFFLTHCLGVCCVASLYHTVTLETHTYLHVKHQPCNHYAFD